MRLCTPMAYNALSMQITIKCTNKGCTWSYDIVVHKPRLVVQHEVCPKCGTRQRHRKSAVPPTHFSDSTLSDASTTRTRDWIAELYSRCDSTVRPPWAWVQQRGQVIAKYHDMPTYVAQAVALSEWLESRVGPDDPMVQSGSEKTVYKDV